MAGDVLVVMAKRPVAGAVKTRLARHLGAAAACALYAAFLRDIASRFSPTAYELVWAVEPAGADLSAYVGARARCVDQVGADLAERMWRCFAQLFDEGARRIVMIGADVPHLPHATVATAFDALAARDVVLVPTRDGGYCLVGLRAPHDVFSGVAMGTANVLAQTEARIEALGLRVRLLDATFDIDELDDLRELARLIDVGVVSLPHTAAALASVALDTRL